MTIKGKVGELILVSQLYHRSLKRLAFAFKQVCKHILHEQFNGIHDSPHNTNILKYMLKLMFDFTITFHKEMCTRFYIEREIMRMYLLMKDNQ